MRIMLSIYGPKIPDLQRFKADMWDLFNGGSQSCWRERTDLLTILDADIGNNWLKVDADGRRYSFYYNFASPLSRVCAWAPITECILK